VAETNNHKHAKCMPGYTHNLCWLLTNEGTPVTDAPTVVVHTQGRRRGLTLDVVCHSLDYRSM